MVSTQATQRRLRPNQNVARQCRPRDIDQFDRPSANAFRLRSDKEYYLSTNWLEYFHISDRSIQLPAIRQSLIDKHRTVKGNDYFVILNVEMAEVACKEVLGINLCFISFGGSIDPSHTGIYGMASDSANAAAELADTVMSSEVHKVSNYL